MSRVSSSSTRKPPLARSPMRLRPRPILRSATGTPSHTPLVTKSQTPSPSWEMDQESPVTLLRPEYQSITSELRALTKMVDRELGNPWPGNDGSIGSGAAASPVFERGRFYDEYAARRDERLKKRSGGQTGGGVKGSFGLGVNVEPGMKKDSKKLESLRKSMPAAFSAEKKENRTPTPRYALRSGGGKENKKPPPLTMNLDDSFGGGAPRTRARRARKI